MAKSKTTFKPGQSGNHKGRKKGVRNKVSQELKAIIHDRGPKYLQALFERAKLELNNPRERNFNATKIVAAFVLKSIPSLQHIAVQADIKQEISERLNSMPLASTSSISYSASMSSISECFKRPLTPC